MLPATSCPARPTHTVPMTAASTMIVVSRRDRAFLFGRRTYEELLAS